MEYREHPEPSRRPDPGPAAALRPLLRAEAAAEAYPAGLDAADVEQCVLLRLLERARAGAPPADAAWLRAAVRAEVRAARRRARREVPYAAGAGPYDPGPRPPSPEEALLAAERRDTLRAALARLPGRCPGLLAALFDTDAGYREVSAELGMSQGSIGPVRSHCLAVLRRMLTAEVAPGEVRGNTR